jgi:transmembrane sensor
MTSQIQDLQLVPFRSLDIEAGHWLLRLLDVDPRPEDPYRDAKRRSEAFLDWASRSPQHVAAFFELYETYSRLEPIDRHQRVNIEALLFDAGNADRTTDVTAHSVAQTDDPDLSTSRCPTAGAKVTVLYPPQPTPLPASNDAYLPRAHTSRAGQAIGVAAVLLIIGLLFQLRRTAVGTDPVHFATPVGIRQLITLPDGSTIMLNTNSEVAVSFGAANRKAQLLRGEMLANIHHDVAHPFLVQSGDIEVVDVGTQFAVQQQTQRTRLTVIEGSVQLSCTPCQPTFQGRTSTLHTEPVAMSLSSGQQVDLTYTDGRARLTRRESTREELARAMAWTNGHLSFKEEPLAEVVKEFNRYNTKQLVIADPAIAQLPLSGYFPAHDPERLIDVVHHQWNIRVLPPDPADPDAIRLSRGE